MKAPPKHTSGPALRNAIRAAFLEAARIEKPPFNLKLFGSEDLCYLHHSLVAALRGLKLPRLVSRDSWSRYYYHPARVVRRAAAILEKELQWSPIDIDPRGSRPSASLATPPFYGKPFSALFQRPEGAEPNAWRIRNSGVQTQPDQSPETCAVMLACKELGIAVEQTYSGSPVNADLYQLDATFLDGGIHGATGNYWCAERGIWVRGRKAVLLIALQIGLKVRAAWHQKHSVPQMDLNELKSEVATSIPPSAHAAP